MKEIEAKTVDPLEKLTINKILKLKESSLSMLIHLEFSTYKSINKLSTGDLDDKMKWLKNFERLLEIQRNVVWPGNQSLPKIISSYKNDFLLRSHGAGAQTILPRVSQNCSDEATLREAYCQPEEVNLSLKMFLIVIHP